MAGHGPRDLVWRIVIALVMTGCGVLPVDPFNPGARQWIIPVANDSNLPVFLAVAEDENPMGNPVGTAQPNTIPPRATVDVVFSVPPTGLGWAIFVNPGPNRGPLITARDVPPGVAGRLPLAISVGPNGDPSVSAPGEPGWFGN
jgi:hypothetical protein